MSWLRRGLWLVQAALRGCGLLPPDVLPAGARVTTYNIGRGARRGGARVETLDRVAATIATHRPDVVALQEVHEPDVPALAALLRDDHDLVYQHTFGEAVSAVRIAGRMRQLRDRGGVDPAWIAGRVGAYGVALLSLRPLEDVRVEPLPGGRGEPRVAIVARTAVGALGEVTVLATHVDTKARARQRDEQTRAVLRLAAAEPGPVLVAGDLNQEPATVAAALAATGSDLVRAGDPDAPTLGPWTIDHVLVTPDLVVAGSVVDHRGVSDHRPLTVSLQL